MKKNNKKLKLSKLQFLSIFLLVLVIIPMLVIWFLDFFFIIHSSIIDDFLYSIYRIQEIALGILTIILSGFGGILVACLMYKKCQKKNKRACLIKNNFIFYLLLAVLGSFYGFLLITNEGLELVKFELSPITMSLFFLLLLIIIVYAFFKFVVKIKGILFEKILIIFSFFVTIIALSGVVVSNFRDIGVPTIYKKVYIVEKDAYFNYRYNGRTLKLRLHSILDDGSKKYFFVDKELYEKVDPPETVIIEQRPFSKKILSIESYHK